MIDVVVVVVGGVIWSVFLVAAIGHAVRHVDGCACAKCDRKRAARELKATERALPKARTQR